MFSISLIELLFTMNIGVFMKSLEIKMPIYKDLMSIDKGIILHGVNCRGVMGAGVAKHLVDKYPIIFEKYKKLCNSAHSPFSLLGTVDFVRVSDTLTIGNCFTQPGVRNGEGAILEAVFECLYQVIKTAQLIESVKVYMPPIGCGLGGLTWQAVGKTVSYLENKYNFPFIVCDIM